MPVTLADRVKETASAPGTGNVTLAGAVADFLSFSQGVGTGNDCYYLIEDGYLQWEIGRGTLSNATTLTRTAGNVKSGSAGVGVLVNFSSNVIVRATCPAEYVNQSRGGVFVKATASGTIALGNCVYISVEDSKVYNANSTPTRAGSFARHMGFAAEAGTTNNTMLVQISGIVSGLSGMTAGRVQYVGSTDGTLTETPLTITPIPMGIAISSTQLVINTQGNHFAITYVTGQKGYYLGGDNGSTTLFSDADILTYSTEVMAAGGSAGLSTVRTNGIGVSEGSFKGYGCGGYSTSSTAVVSTVDKTVYATDTTAALGGTLSQARFALAAVSDNYLKGYLVGGQTAGGLSNNQVVTADRITFATDAIAALAASNLGTATQNLAGASDGAIKGYVAGGVTGANVLVTAVWGIFFATDVTASMSTVLNLARSGMDGLTSQYAFSNNFSLAGVYRKGFFCGGSAAGGITTTVDKITFATDTVSSSTQALGAAKNAVTGNSASSVVGYLFTGSLAGGVTNTGERLNFANETASSLTTTTTNKKQYAYGIGDIG